ncbi:MAG: hypothetical protein HY073_05040 [Deltaproteobacteria bacterium]|nr:hypothetical protein [Deltaproteobacteria bacterium]
MDLTSQAPELKTLKKVIDRLDQASIPYMLTGSMALNFYGQPRATNDFDIVIAVQSSDEGKIFNLFKADYYISRETLREALLEGRLLNIIDHESIFKIDLIPKKKNPYSDEQFKRRQTKEFEGLHVSVISPEDLILAKLVWSQDSLSEMQERDIKNLLKLLTTSLDTAYLDKWAKVLGVGERLRSCRVSS